MNPLEKYNMYDIYQQWHIPFWQTTFFYWFVSIWIIALIGVILFFGLRWYHKKLALSKKPWEIALEKLSLLEKNRYTNQKEIKQCYFIMTSTVKTYLITQYNYPLHGKTDIEIITYIAQETKNKRISELLKEIMNGSLFIRFANAQTVEEQIRHDIQKSKEIIQQTISNDKPKIIKSA